MASAARRFLAAAVLTLAVACGDGDRRGADARAAQADPAAVRAERVRARYGTPDVIAAGAWTWTGPDGTSYVLVDAQSAIAGVVQARLDLWVVTDSAELMLGRSDVMPSAAEIGAFGVADFSGDGLPDLFGYVADSSAVRYPVYLPGARGGITEELSLAAPGWRFDADDPHEPAVVGGAAGPCALQLWADTPAPDGKPAGWRWLLVLRRGLGGPTADEPVCP
jgi:hypothetical protein